MFEYQGFATLGVNLNRQKYGPLDISNVFTSLADLNYYLSKGANKEGVSDYWKNTVPYPYAGQYVALVDNTTRTVTPYMLSEKADGTFEAINLGVPEVDGETIKINNEGKLEAIIPEFEDTNTTYELKVEGVEGGIKITLTPSEGEAQSYTINDPDLSDYITSGELTEALANKANKSDVYTKAETDTKIGEAVAAADHLKRKIIETIEYEDEASTIVDIEKTILNSLSKDEAGNYIDVDKYIYMIPIGPVEDDNKYYEYIAIDISDSDVPEYLFEKVGSWEVNLDAYVTNDTLKDYALKSEIPTDYVTTTDIKNYETAATAEGKYVAKEEGKALIATSELERLAKVNENAEENYIDSVDETKFAVTDGRLELKDLTDYVKVTDATKEEGIRFINATEIAKLNALNLEGSDVTISGSVNASQVKELYPTVVKIITGSASDLDSEQEGLQLGLNIAEGAQVNFIDDINQDIFKVENKTLDLISVPVNKINDLEDWIETNRNTVGGLYPVEAADLLSNLDSAINDPTTGLNTRVNVLETTLTWGSI